MSPSPVRHFERRKNGGRAIGARAKCPSDCWLPGSLPGAGWGGFPGEFVCNPRLRNAVRFDRVKVGLVYPDRSGWCRPGSCRNSPSAIAGLDLVGIRPINHPAGIDLPNGSRSRHHPIRHFTVNVRNPDDPVLLSTPRRAARASRYRGRRVRLAWPCHGRRWYYLRSPHIEGENSPEAAA
jgi:hypothetical protein